MYIYAHAAFLLNFILKNISPKKLIKDGNWYNFVSLHFSNNLKFKAKHKSRNPHQDNLHKYADKLGHFSD